MPPKKPSPVKAPSKTTAKPPAKPAAGRGGPAKKGPPQVTGSKKPGIAPATKGGKPAKELTPQPQKKAWTKEDEAARKIQTKIRQFLAKKQLEKKRKEKMAYNELMDKLEREAFVKLVKMEQEEAEKLRQKEEEERRRKREEAARKKRVLEAAFEGDTDVIISVLNEVSGLDDKNGIGHDVIGRNLRSKHLMNIVECDDANGNTPLSEAASGGNVDTIKMLIEKGADPNTQGQFQRTPLYRAAFAGHLEACEVLLQNGADPRIYASDGMMPSQVASVQAVVHLLENWDISQTEVLLQKLEADKEMRKEEERKRREAEQSKLEAALAEVQKEYDIAQKKLEYAYNELNKRITEHDTAAGMGFDRPDLTIQAIHDQEGEVEILKINLEKARSKLSAAKLKLREQQRDKGDVGEEDLPGLKVQVRELDDVLFRDVGNKIKDSGKWPLIIDTTGQAATFLRYRDTNYIRALSPVDMEQDRARLAILGAIRYGKPLVVDMMEVDMFEAISDRWDGISKGLMENIMDKSITREEKYLPLIKPTDGDEYQKNKFNEYRTSRFKLFIITKNPYPPESLTERMYLIRIHVPL
ncbi:hypothetical protein CHS0354_015422 [Potamilus streckersoni]|uniref:IQ motif and ankyrin repeat domain-containing protein n=1 Tax=Potamilus streckersoni TaxID=2493646 RepID=A0AAE0S0X2_9BIVA|nr:hypothetical protein CHS0354_015422 [Potamilus streckersoni]